MLATGSLVGSATALRVGVGCLELLADRTPPLVRLAVRASVGADASGRAGATFRDDLLALASDAAEVSWHELRRGVDELDALTRPRGEPGPPPRRPHRVKP